MTIPPQGRRQYEFPGITVTIPDQGHWVKAINKPVPPLSQMPGNDEFRPIRVVTNVAIVDYNDESKILSAFDPPIQLDVKYATQDLFEASRVSRAIKLAYWNGSTWVVFTASDNQYQLHPPTTGNVGEVTIQSWIGDPPIAWGT